MLKKIIKDYFSFTKKDRVGLICLVFLITLAYAIPQFYSVSRPLLLTQDTGLNRLIDTLEERFEKISINQYTSRPSEYQSESSDLHPVKNAELFLFDPNTATREDWQRMGLSAKTSQTILNYRDKGGRFGRPEDVKKIWGLPAEFYDRVKDYIVIPKEPGPQQRPYENTADQKKHYQPVSIEINSADTAAWASLPGIGPKLSARIVSFRQKLGGFYAIEQVRETYGLPDSTFQKIKDRLHIVALVRQLNINTATKDELGQHPYIRWQLANAIVEYRNQHGSFTSLDELKNIVAIDAAIFNRLVPYLSL